MSTGTTICAEAQGLYKIFNPGQPSKAEYDGERLHITGGNIRSLRNDEIESVKLDLRLLHHAIVLTLKNGTTLSFRDSKSTQSENCTPLYPTGYNANEQRKPNTVRRCYGTKPTH